jgi:protein neuralized
LQGDLAAPSVSSVQEAPAETSADDDSGLCTICLERMADSAVIPCGHMCGCNECLEEVRKSARPECPMCRGPVSSILKIYRG